jgi:hypothetical protein
MIPFSNISPVLLHTQQHTNTNVPLNRPADFSPPMQTQLLAASPVILSPDDAAAQQQQSSAVAMQELQGRRHSRNYSNRLETSGAGLVLNTSPVTHKSSVTITPMEDESTAAGGEDAAPMMNMASSPSASKRGNAYSGSPSSPRPRPSKHGLRCCFCITCCRDPEKRLSFICLMALIVFFQVVVSCVIVWLLGYLASQKTVASLTSTIRSSIMHDVAFELNDAMQQPLEAAYDINQLVTQRFPDLSTRTTIRNETGWLAELSYVAMRYPKLSRVGFATRNNVYVLITKGAGLGYSDAAFMSGNGGNMTVSVSEPLESNRTALPFLYNYRPTPIHPTPSVAPFALVPEILQTDSAADIASYLGPVISQTPAFSAAARPFYQAAVDVFNNNQTAGWSNVYSSSNVNVAGSFFLAIAAVNAHAASEDATQFGFATFAVTNLDNLNALLDGLPLGNNGFGYFIRTNGHVVSSSVTEVNDMIRNTVVTNAGGSNDLNMFQSRDDWLNILTPILLGWNLITQTPITPRNSSTVVPYRADVYETSVSYSGDQYHVQAVMLTNTTSGLPLSAVIVTKDSDFDSDVRRNVAVTIGLSVLIAVVAGCFAALVTACLARPMMEVVGFMERSVKIIEMERNEKQRKELSILCEEWSGSSGMVLPPLLTSSAFVGMAIKEDPSAINGMCGSACCDPKLGFLACGGVGRSLREVQSMHRAFGSMLYSLASYDELEAINHAKVSWTFRGCIWYRCVDQSLTYYGCSLLLQRAFIRYIFHEVRVPFNAIVLGIEQVHVPLEGCSMRLVSCDVWGLIRSRLCLLVSLQMELELREHSTMLVGALDTLSIISEQSQVVSRILNDVLSMVRVGDSAACVQLEMFVPL